ncbi:DUF3558 family protein [Actinokineospora sp. HUAS TT18]|uniref:DUF3558 family protein n=1 Tax=Actinokineospora sp. HUAS TT18 TaxID=3447451 RepID=UPI003F528739
MGTLAPRIAALFFSALALTACTTTDPTPTPVPQPTTDAPEPTKTTSKTATTSKKPTVARPADKDIKAVDPCQVAAVVKAPELGINPEIDGRASDSDVFPGSKSCTTEGHKANLVVGVEAVVTQGVAEWTNGLDVTVTPLTIEGYPAAVVRPKRPTSCFAVVDVNDGQMMFFQLTVGAPDRQPVTSLDDLCAKAQKIAETGMKVVLAG